MASDMTVEEAIMRGWKFYNRWCERRGVVELPTDPENRNPFLKEEEQLKIMSDKVKICSACNGSGIYDNTGSPKCGSCKGLGFDRSKMPFRLWKRILIKYYGKSKLEIEEAYA